MKTIKGNGVIPLVNSSNVLVTKLGEYAKDSSENSIFLQRLFAVLNIGVTSAFIFYIIRKLLKPILEIFMKRTHKKIETDDIEEDKENKGILSLEQVR